MQDPLSIATQYWGFTSFRPLQKDIINTVGILKKDTIALLPTGGGKSLCYQIPAIANEGIAIVISPLIALMKDQTDSLKEKGIKAIALPSGIPYKELDALLDNCIYGNYKMLYVSPERLQQEIVLTRIKQMNVSLIAVDEAHCISQWGHDFRPAYREIFRLREIHPASPIIALTATATPKVLKEIASELHMKDPECFQSSYERPNLVYTIRQTPNKRELLIKGLTQHQESAIVYVRNRKSTVEIAELLNQRGIKAAAYHGGMPQDQRNKNYAQWRDDVIRVIVGTNAFGMGIDKGNVDLVVHLEIPDSIENYFQEAGRAGRNGQPAKALLVYNQNDMLRLDNQFVKIIPQLADVKWIYKKLNAYFQIPYGEGADTTHSFNFSSFCAAYQLPTVKTYNTLLSLERNSIIHLTKVFSKRARVLFKQSEMALTYYLVKNPGLEKVAKTLLRTYGGIHEQEMAIDHNLIASKADCSIAQVHQALLRLDTDDIITYEHQSFDTSITFLVPREDEHTINVIARYVKAQAQKKQEQVAAMKAFVHQQQQCRTISILKYFGEDATTPCGRCDVCISELNDQPKRAVKSLEQLLLDIISEDQLSSKELIMSLTNLNKSAENRKAMAFRESDILQTLKTLLAKEKITLTTSNRYKIK